MQYANITVQLSILVLLFLSLIIKKKRKYVWHGNIMLLAVIMNALLLLAHMGPSLRYVPDEPLFVTVLGIIHAIIGTAAEALGLWITVPWAFGNAETKSCATKWKYMRKTMILWVVALGIGLVFYVFHTLYEV
jgi:cadmium resistance protein CadD (predicted permease)